MNGGTLMIVPTHWVFSKLLYQAHIQGSERFISKMAFRYGNIRPDIHPSYSKVDHTIEETFEIVTELSNRLQNEKLNRYQFSVVLGMMSHYLCDYFCLYHSDAYIRKSIIEHIQYEIRVHFKLINLMKSKQLKPPVGSNLYLENMETVILKAQINYFQSEHNHVKDIDFALKNAGAMIQAAIWDYQARMESGWIETSQTIA